MGIVEVCAKGSESLSYAGEIAGAEVGEVRGLLSGILSVEEDLGKRNESTVASGICAVGVRLDRSEVGGRGLTAGELSISRSKGLLRGEEGAGQTEFLVETFERRNADGRSI